MKRLLARVLALRRYQHLQHSHVALWGDVVLYGGGRQVHFVGDHHAEGWQHSDVLPARSLSAIGAVIVTDPHAARQPWCVPHPPHEAISPSSGPHLVAPAESQRIEFAR